MVSWLVDMYHVHLYNLLLTLDLYLFFWPNSFPSSGCKVQKEKKQQQKTSPTIMETLKYLVNKFLWRYLYSSVVNSPRNHCDFFSPFFTASTSRGLLGEDVQLPLTHASSCYCRYSSACSACSSRSASLVKSYCYQSHNYTGSVILLLL